MADQTPYKLKFDPTVFGSTGLRQYGGFVSEEYLKELQGVRGAKTYTEMSDNDPIVGAVLFAITKLIRQAKPTFQAKDESPEAEDGKVFAEEVFGDMERPFSDVVDEVCTMFRNGFAPMEILWKRRQGPDAADDTTRSQYSDGRIGLLDVSLRAQETVTKWDIEDTRGKINGFWQQPWSGPQAYIPGEKFLLFRTTAEKNNPEGRSILRTAYRSWYFKKRIEEIEGVGLERDLAGLPLGEIPAAYMAEDADPQDKMVYQAWQRMVTNVRRDKQEGIIIPSDRDDKGNRLFDLRLLSTGGSRAFDTTKIIDRYDRRIATSVLADFIFLGQQSVGSFALSSDKTALFATALGAFLQSIADTFNRYLMPRLWRLNGLPPETMPTLAFSDIEKPNLGELAQFITAMSGAGAPLFPDRELENSLREAAGLPLAPEDGAGGGDIPETPPPNPKAVENHGSVTTQ